MAVLCFMKEHHNIEAKGMQICATMFNEKYLACTHDELWATFNYKPNCIHIYAYPSRPGVLVLAC